MPHVICRLPFASELINGVAFESIDGAMRTVDSIDDDTADNFALIPGYEIEASAAAPAPARSAGRPSRADVDAAIAAIVELGGTPPEGAKLPALLDMVAKLKADKDAAANADPAPAAVVEPDDEPVAETPAEPEVAAPAAELALSQE